MTLTKSKYYFEALDNFPYNLPACIEALNYALSYDPEDADSLCLMGRVYAEILNNYEQAIHYFEEAMKSDLTNVNTPKYYISCLLNNGDLDEAEKLINFSINIKAMDQYSIYFLKSVLLEKRDDIETALKTLEQARKFCYNEHAMNSMEDRKTFLKNKKKNLQKNSKKQKKKREAK